MSASSKFPSEMPINFQLMEASLEANMLGEQMHNVMVLAKAGRVQGEGRSRWSGHLRDHLLLASSCILSHPLHKLKSCNKSQLPKAFVCTAV